MADTNNSSMGIGLDSVLFVVFLVLKLTGYIDWSWVWVLSPLWIPFVLIMVILFFGLIFGAFSPKPGWKRYDE